MFQLNDKVVYPGHGVALISKIVSRSVANQTITFYELQFQNKDMTIMIPLDRLKEVGIRPLSSPSKIKPCLLRSLNQLLEKNCRKFFYQLEQKKKKNINQNYRQVRLKISLLFIEI